MATVTIRNIPDDLVERIKAKAEANQRSMEEEIRQTLQQEYPSAEAWAASVRTLRAGVETPATLAEIHEWIDEGRDASEPARRAAGRVRRRRAAGERARPAAKPRGHAADRPKK